jgi:hypothetical protein
MSNELAKLRKDQAAPAQRLALTRLQLYTMGEIHRLMRTVVDKSDSMLRPYNKETELSTEIAQQTGKAVLDQWDNALGDITELLDRGIRQAAAIPFGQWAVLHDRQILPFEPRTEAVAPSRLVDDNLNLLLADIIRRVKYRHYQDQMGLSARIWRMDANARRGIRETLAAGVARQQSTWDTAVQLERFLGSGADCPRWTRTRLRLTAGQMAAGNRAGLKSGGECANQGVAFNAFRLARTELHFAANLMTDEIYGMLPFVEYDRIHLSAQHPRKDICDGIISNGLDGEGLYEKGTVSPPFHPLCLCYKTPELMPYDRFNQQMRSWLRGGQPWSDMDAYQNTVGGSLWVRLGEVALAGVMAKWMFGKPSELDEQFWEGNPG